MVPIRVNDGLMRRAALIAPALLLSPLLVACGAGGGDDGPTVVTSAYPFEFLVERVAGFEPRTRRTSGCAAECRLAGVGLDQEGLEAHFEPAGRRLVQLRDQGHRRAAVEQLPLDAHPELGNNARLAAALGLEPDGGFLNYKGLDVGLTCTTELAREELIARFTTALGGGRVHVCAGGPAVCRRIGLSTGGSGSEVAAAAAAGIDTFLTGEGPHWSYTLAEELGLNVLYGGHYATETFGVKALAADLEARFNLPWTFIDHPTGL